MAEYLEEIKKKWAEFKEVSVAEFFEKNKHLLGFESPRKALYITVKEAVDNSLDACEEAKILPEVKVEIIEEAKAGVYTVRVYDNGPGIPKDHVPGVFGKFLYGSKFHRYVCTRGKQGIGISACTLYAQLTTGQPAKIVTKTPFDDKVHYFEIKIDVKKNEPQILEYKEYSPDYAARKYDWKFLKDHGTIVEFTIKAEYVRGKQSPDEYITLTALANPHANIIYITPKTRLHFERISTEIPTLYETRPHPHGIEIGVLERMLRETKYSNLKDFLIKEFACVGQKTAEEILQKAGLDPYRDPHTLSFEEIEKLYDAMQSTKVRAIPAKYIVTLGEEKIKESLAKMYNPEFVTAVTRKPAVYRGIPFIVEVGIAYGGSISEFKLIRLANRVPLLYKPGECAITEALKEINWKRYGLSGEEGTLPKEPMVIMVHVASVWIPFTSESKEAIAPYPEIVKEIQLAVKEALRPLALYLKKKETLEEIGDKYKRIYGYGLELARYLCKIVEAPEEEVREIIVKRIKEEVFNDVLEVLRTVDEVREAVERGNVMEVLKTLLKPLIKDKVLTEEDLKTFAEKIKDYTK